MTHSQATAAINAVIADPAASDLLRFICSKSLHRDPLDAAGELEYAAKLFANLADASVFHFAADLHLN